MKCIILAGGFATRLWPLTEKAPKPLLYLAGKPLISHILTKIPEDIDVYVSVNSAFSDQFEAWQKTEKRKVNIFVEDANFEDEKLGALYSVSYCIQQNKINDDVLLIAGDNFFGFKSDDFFASFKGDPLIAVYDIKSREEAKSFGVIVGKNSKVKQFMEKPQNPPSTLVSTGCYVIPKKCLAELHKYAEVNRDDLGGIFEHFMSQGIDVDYFSFDQEWFDIGSFNAFLEANKHLIKDNLINGAGVQKEATETKGSVFIGANSVVKNSIIQDSIIMEDVYLENVCIKNSVIGRGSHLKNLDLDTKIIRDESFIVM
jgi:glucose-1-phosphate thymidylyltransferase